MMIRYVKHIMILMALFCCGMRLSAAEEHPQPQKTVGLSLFKGAVDEIRQIRVRVIDGHNNAHNTQQKEEVLADAEKQLSNIKGRLELFKDDGDSDIEDEMRQTENTIGVLKSGVKSAEARNESRIQRIKMAVENGLFKEALDTASRLNDPLLRDEQTKWILMQKKEKKELFRAVDTPRESKSLHDSRPGFNRVLSTFNRQIKEAPTISTFITPSLSNLDSPPLITSDDDPAAKAQEKSSSNGQSPMAHLSLNSPRNAYVNRKTMVAGLMGAVTMSLLTYVLATRETNPAMALKSLALIFDSGNPEHQKKARELLIAIDVYLQKHMAYMPDDLQQLIFTLFDYIEYAKHSSMTRELLLEIAIQALKVG